jgi:DNA-binding transcriptional MerR regulator
MSKDDKPRVHSPDPTDSQRIILRLVLSAGKAAELCGISRRQLCYWTDKGVVEAVGEDEASAAPRRAYTLAALYRVTLIKREIDRGHSLHRAAQEVDRRLGARAQRQRELLEGSPAQREEFLIGHAERLREVAGRLRQAAAAHRGPRALLPVARALLTVRETEAGGDALAGLRDDPEACCRLAQAVDSISALLDELGIKPAARPPTEG